MLAVEHFCAISVQNDLNILFTFFFSLFINISSKFYYTI